MLKGALGQHGGFPEDQPGVGAHSIDTHVVIELAQVQHFRADQLDGVLDRGDIGGRIGGCESDIFREYPLAVHSASRKILPVATLQKDEVLRPLVHGTPRERESLLPELNYRIHMEESVRLARHREEDTFTSL